MVENYKQRHRGVALPLAFQKYAAACKKFGGSYGRYSCDNSAPDSVLDQIVNSLNCARKHDCFIPWDYIYADYAVSGLNSSRQGYNAYKDLLRDSTARISTTFIDDFTRASRDELEWWFLAALCKRLQKGFRGASDGFNLDDANSEIFMMVFGLVSRLFLKGLREKVRRGMKGTARRGGCLGKLPLGFTKRAQLDDTGRPILDQNGLPQYEPCIDPPTRPDAELLFQLFTEELLTHGKIARRFNQLCVDGWRGFIRDGIKKMLANPAYIGVFIWNRTHTEFDPDTNKYVKVPNPMSEWEYHYDARLAIISHEQWWAAKERLAQMQRNNPARSPRLSRNEISATTLFSGTLYCQCCQHELTLIRSTDKYKQMACPNGSRGLHECTLVTSKSTGIIERCLLPHILDVIITDESIEKLVVQANEYLKQETAKPRVDTTRFRSAAQKMRTEIDKLVGRVANAGNAVAAVYEEQIARRVQELQQINKDIREAEAQNTSCPEPLNVDRVKAYLADLRALLNQNIPVAAAAIRALTGKIMISQEPIPGRKNGARWIATFTPQLVNFLKIAGQHNDYPESLTSEHLTVGFRALSRRHE